MCSVAVVVCAADAAAAVDDDEGDVEEGQSSPSLLVPHFQ